MTTRKDDLLKMLRGGGRLRSDITGWRLTNDRKLRAETQEALEATKELVEIFVEGKHIAYELIVHKNHVAAWTQRIRGEGKKIIRSQPRDDD